MELATLVARRGQFKGQLTRLSTYIKDNVENVDVEQIILRKEKAKKFGWIMSRFRLKSKKGAFRMKLRNIGQRWKNCTMKQWQSVKELCVRVCRR